MGLNKMAVFGKFAAPQGIHGVLREEGVMRKFIVGLIVTGLLMSAGQASAVDNGTADPQSLIASGVIQPFWASPDTLTSIGDFTLFELSSPVGDNSGWYKGPIAHALFFTAACKELFSLEFPMTENDILTFTTFDVPFPIVGGFAQRENGLMVLAASFNKFKLVPLENPIHSVGHWVSIARDFIRVVEPTQVAAAEANQSYSPLKSAASFVNPPVGPAATDFKAELFLVCPNQAIYDALAPSKKFVMDSEEVEVDGLKKRFSTFPFPPKVTTKIFAVAYNSDEDFVIDYDLTCTCLTRYDLAAIAGGKYETADPGTENLFYTELFSYQDVASASDPPAFTGYLGTTWPAAPGGGSFPGGTGDQFQRLNNGSAFNYLGLGLFERGLR